MPNPIFSIVVVTYNRRELLSECLRSFQNQTFKDFELIVVDRGSVPSTEDVVANFDDNRFSYVQSSQDVHFCDIGNSVVKNTKGQYLMVFGDDDVIHPRALELANNAFEKNQDCDIVMTGSISVKQEFQQKIFIPSDFSIYSDFPYFQTELMKSCKFSGKDYLKWVMSIQYIGNEIACKFPSYIHPSTIFIRKSANYEKVVENQGGIMVKPSSDSGYLGLAHYTNILYLNVPLSVIRRGNNVSEAPRRFWNIEVEDHKYMPKIAQIDNRGTDSILNVIHLNGLEKEYDIKVRHQLYKKILRELMDDPIQDSQTFKDYIKLFPYYVNSTKSKIKAVTRIVKAMFNCGYRMLFPRKSNSQKPTYMPLKCTDALNMVDRVYGESINTVNEALINNDYCDIIKI